MGFPTIGNVGAKRWSMGEIDYHAGCHLSFNGRLNIDMLGSLVSCVAQVSGFQVSSGLTFWFTAWESYVRSSSRLELNTASLDLRYNLTSVV